MTKIAIPVANRQLNGHFGHTQQFYIFNIENNSIVKEEKLTPPPHEPGLYPKWLAEMGVTNVIAAGMGQKAIALFNQNKISVFVGVPIKDPKELVLEFINGTLETKDNTCSH
jgi:predicted Fe-Mo cluster-binding NifX family protein